MAATRVATATMRAAQIAKPGGEFEVVERQIPKPGAGQVLIKVKACGVCHSDVFVKEGLMPGILPTHPSTILKQRRDCAFAHIRAR